MDKLAEKLAYYIAKERVIRKDELEVYKYEFQVALELSFCIVICMMLSAWAQSFVEGVLFWILFFNIRSYLGGIHMKTYAKCLISSCTVFLLGILIAKYLDLNLNFLFMLDVVVLGALWRHSILLDEDDQKARKYFTSKIQKKIVIISIAIIVLRSLNLSSYMVICSYTLLIVWISLVIGKVKIKFVSKQRVKNISRT